MKKVRNFYQGYKKFELCSIFILQHSDASLNINQVMAPQPLKKVVFFRQNDPQKESKCKNAQFLQWILKDSDVYFKKITAS